MFNAPTFFREPVPTPSLNDLVKVIINMIQHGHELDTTMALRIRYVYKMLQNQAEWRDADMTSSEDRKLQ